MRLWMIRAIGLLAGLHVAPYMTTDGIRRPGCIGLVIALNDKAAAAMFAHEKAKKP